MESQRLTNSLEDYLEAIYLIKKETGEAHITDIALRLKCSKPSVNKAVFLLKEKELLSQEKYGQISLTRIGEKTAKDIYFRHQTLIDFLCNTLEVDYEIAKIDACKMEHVISRQTLENLLKYMKNNTK